MDLIRFTGIADPDGIWVGFKKGDVETIVAVHDNITLVISATYKMENGAPFVPYVAVDGGNSGSVYEHYLHLIGKIARKAEDSKYFGCPRFGEHCKNGFPFDTSPSLIEGIAKNILLDVEAAVD